MLSELVKKPRSYLSILLLVGYVTCQVPVYGQPLAQLVTAPSNPALPIGPASQNYPPIAVPQQPGAAAQQPETPKCDNCGSLICSCYPADGLPQNLTKPAPQVPQVPVVPPQGAIDNKTPTSPPLTNLDSPQRPQAPQIPPQTPQVPPSQPLAPNTVPACSQLTPECNVCMLGGDCSRCDIRVVAAALKQCCGAVAVPVVPPAGTLDQKPPNIPSPVISIVPAQSVPPEGVKEVVQSPVFVPVPVYVPPPVFKPPPQPVPQPQPQPVPPQAQLQVPPPPPPVQPLTPPPAPIVPINPQGVEEIKPQQPAQTCVVPQQAVPPVYPAIPQGVSEIKPPVPNFVNQQRRDIQPSPIVPSTCTACLLPPCIGQSAPNGAMPAGSSNVTGRCLRDPDEVERLNSANPKCPQMCYSVPVPPQGAQDIKPPAVQSPQIAQPQPPVVPSPQVPQPQPQAPIIQPQPQPQPSIVQPQPQPQPVVQIPSPQVITHTIVQPQIVPVIQTPAVPVYPALNITLPAQPPSGAQEECNKTVPMKPPVYPGVPGQPVHVPSATPVYPQMPSQDQFIPGTQKPSGQKENVPVYPLPPVQHPVAKNPSGVSEETCNDPVNGMKDVPQHPQTPKPLVPQPPSSNGDVPQSAGPNPKQPQVPSPGSGPIVPPPVIGTAPPPVADQKPCNDSTHAPPNVPQLPQTPPSQPSIPPNQPHVPPPGSIPHPPSSNIDTPPLSCNATSPTNSTVHPPAQPPVNPPSPNVDVPVTPPSHPTNPVTNTTVPPSSGGNETCSDMKKPPAGCIPGVNCPADLQVPPPTHNVTVPPAKNETDDVPEPKKLEECHMTSNNATEPVPEPPKEHKKLPTITPTPSKKNETESELSEEPIKDVPTPTSKNSTKTKKKITASTAKASPTPTEAKDVPKDKEPDLSKDSEDTTKKNNSTKVTTKKTKVSEKPSPSVTKTKIHETNAPSKDKPEPEKPKEPSIEKKDEDKPKEDKKEDKPKEPKEEKKDDDKPKEPKENKKDDDKPKEPEKETPPPTKTPEKEAPPSPVPSTPTQGSNETCTKEMIVECSKACSPFDSQCFLSCCDTCVPSKSCTPEIVANCSMACANSEDKLSADKCYEECAKGCGELIRMPLEDEPCVEEPPKTPSTDSCHHDYLSLCSKGCKKDDLACFLECAKPCHYESNPACSAEVISQCTQRCACEAPGDLKCIKQCVIGCKELDFDIQLTDTSSVHSTQPLMESITEKYVAKPEKCTTCETKPAKKNKKKLPVLPPTASCTKCEEKKIK